GGIRTASAAAGACPGRAVARPGQCGRTRQPAWFRHAATVAAARTRPRRHGCIWRRPGNDADGARHLTARGWAGGHLRLAWARARAHGTGAAGPVMTR